MTRIVLDVGIWAMRRGCSCSGTVRTCSFCNKSQICYRCLESWELVGWSETTNLDTIHASYFQGVWLHKHKRVRVAFRAERWDMIHFSFVEIGEHQLAICAMDDRRAIWGSKDVSITTVPETLKKSISIGVTIWAWTLRPTWKIANWLVSFPRWVFFDLWFRSSNRCCNSIAIHLQDRKVDMYSRQSLIRVYCKYKYKSK